MDADDVIVTIALIAAGIAGYMGNAVVLIYLFAAKVYKKTNTNWYILQLAIANVGFLTTVPLRIKETLYGYWIHSVQACKANQGIMFINYCTSVLFLILMSIDRYIAVCHPFSSKWQKLRQRRVTFIVTAVVWTFSIASAVPIIKFSDVFGQEKCSCMLLYPGTFEDSFCDNFTAENPNFNFTCPSHKCISEKEVTDFRLAQLKFKQSIDIEKTTFLASHENATYLPNTTNTEIESLSENSNFLKESCLYFEEKTNFILYLHVWSNFVGLFLLPTAIMSLCYGLIIKKFQKTAAAVKLQSGVRPVPTNPNKKSKKRRHLTILCVTLVVSFTLCWVLHHILEFGKLYHFSSLSENSCRILSKISVVLIYINSALHSYLYGFLGAEFKRKLRLWKSSSFAQFIVKQKSRLSHLLFNIRKTISGTVGDSSRQCENAKTSQIKTSFEENNLPTKHSFSEKGQR